MMARTSKALEPRRVSVVDTGQTNLGSETEPHPGYKGFVALVTPIEEGEQGAAVQNAQVICKTLGFAGVSVTIAEGGETTQVVRKGSAGEIIFDTEGQPATESATVICVTQAGETLTKSDFEALCLRVGTIVDRQAGQAPLFEPQLDGYSPICATKG